MSENLKGVEKNDKSSGKKSGKCEGRRKNEKARCEH